MNCDHEHVKQASPLKGDKRQKRFLWAIVVSELSHVFCCVLPTMFSLVSLLAGFGVIATMPGWLESLHHIMHGWELPMIGFSAVVLLIGWGLHFYSLKEDCHNHGCEHEPCGPNKRRASKILIAASVLFVFNVVIYFGVHRPQDAAMHAGHGHHGHDH